MFQLRETTVERFLMKPVMLSSSLLVLHHGLD
jgi:hypothetical protein